MDGVDYTHRPTFRERVAERTRDALERKLVRAVNRALDAGVDEADVLALVKGAVTLRKHF